MIDSMEYPVRPNAMSASVFTVEIMPAVSVAWSTLVVVSDAYEYCWVWLVCLRPCTLQPPQGLVL